MDDGGRTVSGFNIHTKGYTFKEVTILAGILHYCFDLHCIIQNHVGYPVIYIPAKHFPKFVRIVKPYLAPSEQMKNFFINLNKFCPFLISSKC
jgi:hypothetical protein